MNAGVKGVLAFYYHVRTNDGVDFFFIFCFCFYVIASDMFMLDVQDRTCSDIPAKCSKGW